MDQTTITASAAELQVLSDLLARCPSTLGEKLWIDSILSRWFRQSSRAPMMQESTGVPTTMPPLDPNTGTNDGTPEATQAQQSGDPASS